MKFCPKCGGLMLPIKKGDKIILKCTKCGYEIDAKNLDKNEYKVIEKVSEEQRVVTTSKVSEAPARVGRRPEEQEQEREEYYEIALELLQEEFEGGEEE